MNTQQTRRDVAFNFAAHLLRQREWSERTFGPGSRAAGIVDHIRKELREIEADPGDLREWIDVVILGLDGAWRTGATPEQIIGALVAKQAKNEDRAWPDWRTADPNKAIEHDRSQDTAPQPAEPDDLAPLARAVGYDTPSDGELRGVIKRMGHGHLVEPGRVQITGKEVIDIVRAFASPGRLRTAMAEVGDPA